MKHSALASLGLLAGCTTSEKKMHAKQGGMVSSILGRRIRIALIGIGSRGNDILKVIMEIPELHLVACCDRVESRVNSVAEKMGHEVKGYLDYKEMMQVEKLDAVAIASPLYMHYPMIMEAMNHSLHIMCEKALTLTLEEAIAVKNKANGYDKHFQVSYQYQLNPTFNAIKELIDKGYCGKITRIDCTWHRNSDWRRKIPEGLTDREVNWRMYKEYSGGLMAELGSHQLNMVDTLLGASPTQVMGMGDVNYWKDGREVFDNVYTLYDYPNGAKASFSSILSNKYEGFKMKIFGDEATIISHGMNEAFLYLEDAKNKKWEEKLDSISGASMKIVGDSSNKRKIYAKSIESVFGNNNYMNTTWILYKNFTSAIRGDAPLFLGIEEGYKSAVSVHLSNQALYENTIVDWKKDYDV